MSVDPPSAGRQLGTKVPPVIALSTAALVAALVTVAAALATTQPDRHARGLLAALAAVAAAGLLGGWLRVAIAWGRSADPGARAADPVEPPVDGPVDDGTGGRRPVE